ncbi:hypothetical protein [Liquorilactobacillus nagelii]|jgi:hypothetical protein|uniref:hypothetical protein n=1 Tax=Liquorilactobacillus nagelii TaxID=82688 RepID=UPI00242E7543|nr:hypothetical protein [Liquorilactobacillus nagelii]MCI1700668.1 hypothetical protein [Liquorilactobacillus nagelii]
MNQRIGKRIVCGTLESYSMRSSEINFPARNVLKVNGNDNDQIVVHNKQIVDF